MLSCVRARGGCLCFALVSVVLQPRSSPSPLPRVIALRTSPSPRVVNSRFFLLCVWLMLCRSGVCVCVCMYVCSCGCVADACTNVCVDVLVCRQLPREPASVLKSWCFFFLFFSTGAACVWTTGVRGVGGEMDGGGSKAGQSASSCDGAGLRAGASTRACGSHAQRVRSLSSYPPLSPPPLPPSPRCRDAPSALRVSLPAPLRASGVARGLERALVAIERAC